VRPVFPRLALSLILCLAGCGDIFGTGTSESITFSTDRRQYNTGDTIYLNLTNRSSVVLLFNDCMDATVFKDGAPLARPTVCAAYLEELAPHATVNLPFRVKPEWTTGQYRISLSVGFGNLQTRRVVQTEVFSIRS
jgi:hypothetical protein